MDHFKTLVNSTPETNDYDHVLTPEVREQVSAIASKVRCIKAHNHLFCSPSSVMLTPTSLFTKFRLKNKSMLSLAMSRLSASPLKRSWTLLKWKRLCSAAPQSSLDLPIFASFPCPSASPR